MPSAIAFNGGGTRAAATMLVLAGDFVVGSRFLVPGMNLVPIPFFGGVVVDGRWMDAVVEPSRSSRPCRGGVFDATALNAAHVRLHTPSCNDNRKLRYDETIRQCCNPPFFIIPFHSITAVPYLT